MAKEKMINLFKQFQNLMMLLLALTILHSCSKDEEPSSSISDISPQEGTAGTLVTINGKGLGDDINNIQVKFNGNGAGIYSASPTEIVASVPADAGTGPVTVEVGNKIITGPVFTYLEAQVTQKYYFKFKVNGTWKTMESANPGYQSCGDCACCGFPISNTAPFAEIQICQTPNYWITAGNILSWDQKTIPFKTNNTYPVAAFSYFENGITRETYWVEDQSGSSVKVTKIEADGSSFGKSAYKVSGTFQCKVAKSDGTSVQAITEGQFVVRLWED